MGEVSAAVQPFGAFVRRRRRACRLTQEALAGLVGVDQTWVSQVERDFFTPAKAKVAPLAAALGVSRREIYLRLGEIEPAEGEADETARYPRSPILDELLRRPGNLELLTNPQIDPVAMADALEAVLRLAARQARK